MRQNIIDKLEKSMWIFHDVSSPFWNTGESLQKSKICIEGHGNTVVNSVSYLINEIL